MRVKHDHPDTAGFPKKVRQSPATNVSEELESIFNNALKPKTQPANLQQKSAKDQADSTDSTDSTDSSASLDGLYLDPKDIIDGFPKGLNTQPAPIQFDGKAATSVQNVLNGQRLKPDTTVKEAVTLSNAQINTEAKATLSAFEEKLKPLKRIDLHHSTSEVGTKLHSAANINQPTTQGDVILKSMEAQTPRSSARNVNDLISKLVEKIYVSLPTANEKEVRLFLNEGQLKGGEISIKHDSSGYSVLIKQEHALSLINPNAKQELVERLQRLGIEQPIRISISEQMNQQQDQQRSRQQRSIYDEWKPEDE
ncbi:type III secretion system needle length determinant [Vibrio sp. 1F263]|uniref:type III secretion system needle length determinant n=1 Tax=Vibrio sp. 1F263 TaxID=3230012 RepID=UPI00352BE23F